MDIKIFLQIFSLLICQIILLMLQKVESNLSGVIGTIPSYYILDLNLRYGFSKYIFECGINNLLNCHYYTRRAYGLSWSWYHTISSYKLFYKFTVHLLDFKGFFLNLIDEKFSCIYWAGIKAESGLSTFRDSGGLWDKYKIEEVIHQTLLKVIQN